MSYPIHPDDMPSPRFGGWADNFNTYEEACEFYGADTPAQVAAEVEYYNNLEWIDVQDDMEIRGGPKYGFVEFSVTYRETSPDDDFPF